MLHTQATRGLTLSYLRELAASSKVQDTGWRIAVQVDSHSPDLALMVIHNLALTVKEVKIAERIIRMERL